MLLRSCIRRDRLIGCFVVDLISFVVEGCVVMVVNSAARDGIIGMFGLLCCGC